MIGDTPDGHVPATPAASERADPSAMSLPEARRRLLESLVPIEGVETLGLVAAAGRTLAEDVHATVDVPPFRASAMDGHALRASEAHGPLREIGVSLAGHPGPDRLGSGECVRVTTGARVPDDADAVVQSENLERIGDEVHVRVAPTPGHHVREAGSDSRRGERLASAGDRLRPSLLAVLASHGIGTATVRRPLRVALLSTGDELREPGAALGPGQVHDANRPLLATLLAAPGIEIVDLGIVADTPEALAAALASRADVDAWVSSGGVSVGEADHVRDALGAGGEIVFWKVAMKPGRPLAFGRVAGVPWFGLPGNPVSAAVTSLLLVRPALAALSGRSPSAVHGIEARMEGTLTKVPGRLEFQRGRLRTDERGRRRVADAGLQESHGLRSLARADCLVELPADSRGAADGELVTVHPFELFAEAPL